MTKDEYWKEMADYWEKQYRKQEKWYRDAANFRAVGRAMGEGYQKPKPARRFAFFFLGLILGQAGAYGYVLANPPEPTKVPYQEECELSDSPGVAEITAMLETMPKVKGRLVK